MIQKLMQTQTTMNRMKHDWNERMGQHEMTGEHHNPNHRKCNQHDIYTNIPKQNYTRGNETKTETKTERIFDGDQPPLDLPLVGTYEAKKEETTVKLVLLENGKSEHWVNGEKKGEATWKIVEKEVRVLGRKRLFFGDGEDARVYKIEPNGDLTWIANIRDGKRGDVPKEDQPTFKRIK